MRKYFFKLFLLQKLIVYSSSIISICFNKIIRKKIVVWDITEIGLIPFILPVHNELQKCNNISHYYLINDYRKYDLSKVDFPKIKFVPYSLFKKYFFIDLFVSPHVFSTEHKNIPAVHIPHGPPVKFACLQKRFFTKFKYHFVINQLHYEQTINTINEYDLNANDYVVKKIGYPKIDKLYNNPICRDDFLRSINLNPKNKTILYAPSWEENLSIRKYGTGVVEQLLKVKNINVILKLHHMSCLKKGDCSFFQATGGIEWMRVFNEKFSKNPRFFNYKHDDISPLLSVADIMVSDFSGVTLEFFRLNKPVLFIDCPDFYNLAPLLYHGCGRFDAEYLRNDPRSNAGRHVAYITEKLSNLSEDIVFLMENMDYKQQERDIFIEKLIYNNGNASECASEEILKILELN